MAARSRSLIIAGAASLALLVILFVIAEQQLAGRRVPAPSNRRTAVSAIAERSPVLDTPRPSELATTPSPTVSPSLATTSPSQPRVISPTPTPSQSNIGQESVSILFDQSGQGNAVTTDFQVPSQWLLYWSYACTPPASTAGSLKVTIFLKGITTPIKSIASDNGSTNGVAHNYIGDDWYHLAIDSSCSWRLTATPAPGYSISPSPSG